MVVEFFPNEVMFLHELHKKIVGQLLFFRLNSVANMHVIFFFFLRNAGIALSSVMRCLCSRSDAFFWKKNDVLLCCARTSPM